MHFRRLNSFTTGRIPKLLVLFFALAMLTDPAGAQQTTARNPDLTAISGSVTDADKQPLIGVVVSLKGHPGKAIATDYDGNYILSLSDSELKNAVLVFRFLGMKDLEIPLTSGMTRCDAVMEDDSTQIESVVVETGMFQRDKSSFTGSTASFSGTDIQRIGNSNALQSLKSLDPSFMMMDNVSMGSNPNAMPTIELRGQSSATLNAIQDEFSADPNQPLFILNGVEVPISRIVDLDINRVQSITILKDAGSTAIYGSKGANGVVVIETTKPKAGNFQIYYTGDLTISAPDLSGYNMMNSSEKLEFERLAGKYNAYAGSPADVGETQIKYDAYYNYLLSEIEKGVDTYWLAEPVRIGISNAHSVRVSGGHDMLTLDVGGKFKNDQGVMKGSGRNSWNGDITVAYRTNKFILSNALEISGYSGTESPYGSFSNWVNASPYFRKYNAEGGIDKYLQRAGDEGLEIDRITSDVANPLYNAMLGSRDESKQLYISNSLQAQYDISEFFRLKGTLNLTKRNTEYETFLAPEDSSFDGNTVYEKGTYKYRNMNQFTYNAHLTAVYGRVFNDVHSVTAQARTEINQYDNEYVMVEAEGFPMGSNGTPDLAHAYKKESHPGYDYELNRSVGVIASANYSYDKRYSVDFSYRLDGASTFGSNEIYQSFWSAGLGWNINEEKFAKDWKWLDLLKLRASTGTVGNQNIGQVFSQSVYKYYNENNVFGQGIYLDKLGNSNLPWQVSRDINVGMEFRTLGGRVSLVLDVYQKKTDPLILNVPQAPSVGVENYAMNLGNLTNRGIEAVLSVSPILDMQKRTYWTIRLTGAHVKSNYGGFSQDDEDKLNNAIDSNTMQRYGDGQSPTAIWAVRSNGIDPASGREVFIKKNGDLTFNYSADDQVVVGDTRPTLTGVITNSVRIKNFSVDIIMRYAFGGDIYNEALYNKVENITKASLANNQDKRALYDRWKNVGDISEFKAISIVSFASERTSRFVQKDNYLRAESISVGYEMNNNPWLKKNLGVQSLKVSLYGSDLFRLETSKVERGTSYPFARTISLSLKLGF